MEYQVPQHERAERSKWLLKPPRMIVSKSNPEDRVVGDVPQRNLGKWSLGALERCRSVVIHPVGGPGAGLEELLESGGRRKLFSYRGLVSIGSVVTESSPLDLKLSTELGLSQAGAGLPD